MFRLGGGPEDAKEIMEQEFFRPIDWEKLYRKEITPPFKPHVQSDTDTCYFDKVCANNLRFQNTQKEYERKSMFRSKEAVHSEGLMLPHCCLRPTFHGKEVNSESSDMEVIRITC